VETGTILRSDCQNTADLYLIEWSSMAFKPRLFSAHSLPCLDLGKASGCECEGRFSGENSIKIGK
jgi:hypothetical protein